MTDARIKSFQLAFPSFGINFQGKVDGMPSPEFTRAMHNLEDLIQAKTGESMSGKILAGDAPAMSLMEVYRKFFPDKLKSLKPDDEPTPVKSEVKTPVPDPQSKSVDMNESFKQLLSSDLPVVGKLYDGDLEMAAKTLEAAMSKELGRSLSGVIWNDQLKKFNTTPDDIQKALQLIANHNQNKLPQVTSSIDNRFAKMSEMLNQK